MKTGIKQRTFRLMEEAGPDDRASRAVDLFIIGLISLNVIAVVLESIEGLRLRFGLAFHYFEVFSIAAFTLEYLLRLWSCTADSRFHGTVRGRLRFIVTGLSIIDLIAIVPFYLPLVLSFDLRLVRMLRFIRLLRLLKLARYSEALRTMGSVARAKKDELLVTVALVSVVLVLAGTVMYLAERGAQPQAFGSIPAGIWWGVGTLTTVGFGDIYPVTALGKLMGGLMAVLGMGMFAIPAAILTSGFAEHLQKRRKPASVVCPHCGKTI